MTREEFISKYKVGDWVANDYHCCEVRYLSNSFFIGRDRDGGEDVYTYDRNWLPYTPPAPQRKKRLMSPAVRHDQEGNWGVSGYLYESLADARTRCGARTSWPATQIIDGKAVPVQYEVEE